MFKKTSGKSDLSLVKSLVVLFLIAAGFLYNFRHLVSINNQTIDVWNHTRLPSWINPTHYDLKIKPNMSELKFDGNVIIEFEIEQQSDAVILHQLELEVSFVSLTYVQSGKVVKTAQLQENIDKEQVGIYFAEPLEIGNYKIVLNFQGHLKQSLEGFYLSKYYNSEGEEERLVTTHFEPVSARRAFPCFDEPSKKATFAIEITTEYPYHALSNTPMMDKEPLDEKLVRFTFDTSPKMSSYLVAFVVSKLSSII